MNKTSFLQAATRKVNPETLLADNEDWLRSYKKVVPLLDAWKIGGGNPGGLYPHPALMQVCTILATIKEVIENAPKLPLKALETKEATPVIKTLADASKAALAVLAEPVAADPIAEARSQPYIVTLYVRFGEGGVDIGRKDDGKFLIFKVKGHFIEAQRLAARRLFSREDSLFATITKDGIKTEITRGEAFYILNPRPNRPATKKMVKMSANLGNCFRAKQTQARFSGC